MIRVDDRDIGLIEVVGQEVRKASDLFELGEYDEVLAKLKKVRAIVNYMIDEVEDKGG